MVQSFWRLKAAKVESVNGYSAIKPAIIAEIKTVIGLGAVDTILKNARCFRLHERGKLLTCNILTVTCDLCLRSNIQGPCVCENRC
jgi:hypothetical protein